MGEGHETNNIGGQRSRSHEAEVRFGGSLGPVAFLVIKFTTLFSYNQQPHDCEQVTYCILCKSYCESSVQKYL